MLIRPITEADWPAFYPVFRDVVAFGETYAYPEGLSSSEAHELWVESPPGVTVVAVSDDGTVLGSAKSGPNRRRCACGASSGSRWGARFPRPSPRGRTAGSGCT